MSNYLACVIIFRIIFPILIAISAAIRPCVMSGLYLIILLIMPFIQVPTIATMKGGTGLFFKCLTAFSIIMVLCQVAFQIVLFSMPPYGHILTTYPELELILRHFGFVRLNIPIQYIALWVSPEVLMLLTVVCFYIVSVKLTNEETDEETEVVKPVSQQFKSSTSRLLISLGRYLVLSSLCLSAVLRPSVIGGFYFLIFLGVATWWASYKSLGRGFALLLIGMVPILGVHLLTFYTYQFENVHHAIPPNSTYSRYLGFRTLVEFEKHESGFITFSIAEEEWASFALPFILYTTYTLMVLECVAILKGKLDDKENTFSSRLEGSFKSSLTRTMTQRFSNRTLLRSSTTKRRWQSATRKVRDRSRRKRNSSLAESLLQGASEKRRKPYTIKKDEGTEMSAEPGLSRTGLQDSADDESPLSWMESAIHALDALLQIIIKSSYIGTNIVMMAWAITYLSWITFVLLLWANIIWLLPNQRQAMLRCSPFLVLYAWFLLIVGYIYSLDLTDTEMPIFHEHLEEVGFVRVTESPCTHLIVKCLFTSMFWITLRQYLQEALAKRQTSALADMVAPLQITVSTAADVLGDVRQTEAVSKVHKFGESLRKTLTMLWIWIVVITLFAVAVTGNKMNCFRVINMALFLFFILTFQISYSAWRKMMFGFWWTVIIYSMSILVMLYTYQFDNFPTYWSYLHISPTVQSDIGLEKYQTKDLFLKLFTPTFFIIVTIIQLKYFHKDFLVMSDISKPDSTVAVRSPGLAPPPPSASPASPDQDHSFKFNISELGNMSTTELKAVYADYKEKYFRLVDVVFTILEIHMPKFVLLCAMFQSIYDICVVHVIDVIFLTMAFAMGRRAQNTAIFTNSILSSLLILCRMIFQIQYIDPTAWNVDCPPLPGENASEIEPANNVEFLGFQKITEDKPLLYLIRWNVIYLLSVTLWIVIVIRQTKYRVARGILSHSVILVFPDVTAKDSNRDLLTFVKYILNYGFYRFGVEMSLIMSVTLIGVRMDMYAVFHAMWLCVLFSLKRKTLGKIWNLYLAFTAMCLPWQYLMVLGPPPTFCFNYLWADTLVLQQLQDWAFLMNPKQPPQAAKIIFDYILLLFLYRQAAVFAIERKYRDKDYPGGSNASIIHLAEEPEFINPMPDYITYIRSYLDAIKRVVMLGFMWLSLAIMFLAGTNRVNVFSIGYLIGAYIFLWQGSDLYLRPIPTIIKGWNKLITYNVCVILSKTILQIVGCIFVEELHGKACWAVQIFAIGCVKRFHPKQDVVVDDDDLCTVPPEYVGLVWDGLLFACLIIQRRLFNSFNFFHVVNETKASRILSSRGGDLIEELRKKLINDQAENEKQVLEKIKNKMERIKASQKKLQGTFKKTTTHHESIRSGDYFMFDDLDDAELDLLEDKKEEEEPTKDKKKNLSSLISSIMRTDVKTTLGIKRRATEPNVGTQLPQQQQPPLPLSAPPSLAGAPKSTSEDTEPQPSTSKEEDAGDYLKDIEEEEDKDPLHKKLWVGIVLIANIIESSMISMIMALNKHTKDYNYVTKILSKEKKLLKERTNYDVGIRVGKYEVWQPLESYQTLLKKAQMNEKAQRDSTADKLSTCSDQSDTKALATSLPRSSPSGRRKGSVLTVPEIRILAPSLERGLDLDSIQDSSYEMSKYDILAVYETDELSSEDQPTIIRLLVAVWELILSKSEFFCFFMIFLNQIKSATFLSIPLPLMVFLWGTLTSPRPSKTFWISIIAYTEVVVFIKCIFQFEFIPWNRHQDIIKDSFYPPRILGVERKPHFAVWDLLLLLVVYFHRYMLKNMGLWKSTFIRDTPTLPGDYKMTKDGKLEPLIHDIGVTESARALRLAHMTNILFRGITLNLLDDRFQDIYKRRKVSFDSENNAQSLPTEKTDDKKDEEDRKSDDGNKDKDDKSKGSSAAEDLADDEEATIVSVSISFVGAAAVTQVLKTTLMKYSGEIIEFFKQIVHPSSRVATDVYAYMFLCDFINFFVILFGYSSFGSQQGDGGVASYLEENRVPVLFLLMLILQFVLIIVDRGIYLRKHIIGKIIFQFLQIVILHIWLFILYPIITERNFNSALPPQIYYMVKCFYLLFSAHQIMSGYPTRILGNFLCKGYNYLNMFLFKGFMLLPFLFELRTIMDWMWTDTSMTVLDWIKMEDIYAHIFQVKCARYVESEYPTERGQKRTPAVKYIQGFFLLGLIIAIIWFPLVFFSLGNAVGEPNIPYDVTLELKIGTYQPVYQMSAQSSSIESLTDDELNSILLAYSNKRDAVSFLSYYTGADIAVATLSLDSAVLWSISPPDRKRMIEEFNSNYSVQVRMNYKVSHKTSKAEDSGIIQDGIELSVGTSAEMEKFRSDFIAMLNSTDNNMTVHLPGLLPKFIKVTNRGTAKLLGYFMDPTKDGTPQFGRNITLRKNNSQDGNVEWWSIQEECDDVDYIRYLSKLPRINCQSIILYLFNDKIFPSTLEKFTGGGIMSLYTTIVFVASRMMRGMFAEQCFKIMFEDMPNVDRMLQLCLDIYLVRESREFNLEEDLFAKLVFLFRSPETLIKWTRPNEEIDEDEDEDNEIVGLYGVYFLVLFRIMRNTLFSNLMAQIWYRDIPYPDRIHQLMNNIYLMRSLRMYRMEEIMFSKLLFLIRSGELLIKYTRFPGSVYNPNFIFDETPTKRRTLPDSRSISLREPRD